MTETPYPLPENHVPGRGAAVLAALAAMAAPTTIPARIGTRQPVAMIIQSETA